MRRVFVFPVGTQTDATLVEKWDGTAWSIATSPNNTSAGAQFNDLADVTCAAASDCWAVGTTSFASSESTLVLHWDGSAWTLASSPNVSGAGAFSSLSGAVCMSATDCWAVGGGGTATSGTLVEQWNGTAWSIVSSPDPAGTDGSELLGVTCDSGTCWSVGDSQTGAAGDTLAEDYTAPATAATPTPTASPTAGATPSPTPTASPHGGTISVPSAGAGPGATPAGTAVLLLAAAAGAGSVAELTRRRRRR